MYTWESDTTDPFSNLGYSRVDCPSYISDRELTINFFTIAPYNMFSYIPERQLTISFVKL